MAIWTDEKAQAVCFAEFRAGYGEDQEPGEAQVIAFLNPSENWPEARIVIGHELGGGISMTALDASALRAGLDEAIAAVETLPKHKEE
jgi:alpha-beta hydrolase superfamily lysophospholipase